MPGTLPTSRSSLAILYAAAAERWVNEGMVRHNVFVPMLDDLIEPWFRLSFGGSAIQALLAVPERATCDAAAGIRLSTPDDLIDAARLHAVQEEHLTRPPSFNGLGLRAHPSSRTSGGTPGPTSASFTSSPSGARGSPRSRAVVSAAARYASAAGKHRSRRLRDRCRCPRHRSRDCSHELRHRLGGGERLQDDVDGLAVDQPRSLAILAGPRLSGCLRPGLPINPLTSPGELGPISDPTGNAATVYDAEGGQSGWPALGIGRHRKPGYAQTVASRTAIAHVSWSATASSRLARTGLPWLDASRPMRRGEEHGGNLGTVGRERLPEVGVRPRSTSVSPVFRDRAPSRRPV